MKNVPDTAANIKIMEDNGFDESQCKFIANPYDEYAVEQAVQLVEANGGEVVVVCVGSANAVNAMRSVMAMGVHRGILVETDHQFLDSSVTALAIKAAIESDGVADLILTGKGAVDTEGFQTMYRIAKEMDLPVVNEIIAMEIQGSHAMIEQEIGGGIRQRIRVGMPCVLGATRGLNEPRYPKLPDIMKARKKPIQKKTFSELGIDETLAKARLSILTPVAERSEAKMIEGSVGQQAAELVRILREEEKILEN
jgi:electron transfer flavoprotein beta subunit